MDSVQQARQSTHLAEGLNPLKLTFVSCNLVSYNLNFVSVSGAYALCHKLQTIEQAAGHLRWEVGCPPLQPVGSGFDPHWRLTTG